MIQSLSTMQFEFHEASMLLLALAVLCIATVSTIQNGAMRIVLLTAVLGATALIDFTSTPRVIVHPTLLQPKKAYIIGLMDRSGSEGFACPQNDALLITEQITRWEVTRQAFQNFVVTRTLDHIGYIWFGDHAEVKVSLKNGNSTLVNAALREQPSLDTGTNLEEGFNTAIAQFQAFSPPDADRILVVGSDGEDQIKLEAQKRIASELNALHVKVYWVRATDKWALKISDTDRYGPNDLRDLVQLSFGTQLDVLNGNEANLAFDEIARANPITRSPQTVAIYISATGVPTALMYIMIVVLLTIEKAWKWRRSRQLLKTVA